MDVVYAIKDRNSGEFYLNKQKKGFYGSLRYAKFYMTEKGAWGTVEKEHKRFLRGSFTAMWSRGHDPIVVPVYLTESEATLPPELA